jgi:hypothetical protein
MRLFTAIYIYPLPNTSLTLPNTSFHCQLHLSTAKCVFPLPIESFHCQFHLSTARCFFPL